jgi:hypothetical protein
MLAKNFTKICHEEGIFGASFTFIQIDVIYARLQGFGN